MWKMVGGGRTGSHPEEKRAVTDRGRKKKNWATN
jgi:hypothetical protein